MLSESGFLLGRPLPYSTNTSLQYAGVFGCTEAASVVACLSKVEARDLILKDPSKGTDAFREVSCVAANWVCSPTTHCSTLP